jgi:hypothetical protein
MPAKMEFHLHILEDGTATIDTGRIADEVHKEADEIMKYFAQLLGGEVQTIHKRKGIVHEHDHEHAHEHEGGE